MVRQGEIEALTTCDIKGQLGGPKVHLVPLRSARMDDEVMRNWWDPGYETGRPVDRSTGQVPLPVQEGSQSCKEATLHMPMVGQG
jgi:hypothetical protein